MDRNKVFLSLFALCSISFANGACTTEAGCKHVCGQYNGSANLGVYYSAASNPGNYVNGDFRCIKYTFCDGTSFNLFEMVTQGQIAGFDITLPGTINASTDCSNQRTLNTEGIPAFSDYFIQAINWQDNVYGIFYSCLKLPSLPLSEAITLVIKKDQLDNVDSLIADANVWLAQSIFSNLNLVKEPDFDTCFP